MALGQFFTWAPTDTVVVRTIAGLFGGQLVLQLLLTAVPSPLQQKAGVVAHQLLVLPTCIFLCWEGCKMWYFSEELANMHAGSPEMRLYGQLHGAWLIHRTMLGFQVYDFVVTVAVSDLRKVELVLHHLTTLLTAMASAAVGGPYFQVYACFFFGVVELSTIPLLIVDVFKQLPHLLDTPHGQRVHGAAKCAFVLTFLPTRCVIFPRLIVGTFWPDLLAAYLEGDLRCGWGVAGWMLVSSALLTALQLFWGYKLVRLVLKGGLDGAKKVK